MVEAVCDLCSATTHRPVLEKNGGTYLECTRCGFVFTDPRGGDAREANDAYFSESLEAYAARSFDAKKLDRYARLVRMLEPHRRGGRLLEVGCNVGGFLSKARELGWEVTGVEPEPKCAAHAREVSGLDVRASTLEDAALPSGSYDVVYSNAVFEHLPSPSKVLREIARILVPGGVVYIDTVNWDSFTRRRLGADWKLLDPRVHVSLFTSKTLRAFAEKAGLEILRVRTHGVRFRPNRAPKLRGMARWAEEAKKLPVGIWARMRARGDSIDLLARKPT